LNKLDKLLAYLQKEWSITIANDFLDRLEEKIKIIKYLPTRGRTTAIENTRSILITKHNQVYYRIEENKSIIINMIDTRKNPKKNPFNKTT
jgi:plasmid stabilization system protein ParE